MCLVPRADASITQDLGRIRLWGIVRVWRGSSPMTPHAALAPALPVLRDSSSLPRPRSSVPYNSGVRKLHGGGHGKCPRHATRRFVWESDQYNGISSMQPQSNTHPTMLSGPFSEIRWSSNVNFAAPLASLSMLPRSPTWRSPSVGAPCFLLYGLKCAPALRHPLDRSPATLAIVSGQRHYCPCIGLYTGTHWMWNPRLDDGSKFWRSPVTVTGPSGTACSKVTVPPTFESPLSTTTACATGVSLPVSSTAGYRPS